MASFCRFESRLSIIECRRIYSRSGSFGVSFSLFDFASELGNLCIEFVATIFMLVAFLRIIRSLGFVAILICVTRTLKTVLHSTMFGVGFVLQRFNTRIIVVTNTSILIPNRIAVVVSRFSRFELTVHSLSGTSTIFPSDLHGVMSGVGLLLQILKPLERRLLLFEKRLLLCFQPVQFWIS